MTVAIDLKVTLRGGLFSKDVERIAQKQIEHEVVRHVEERLQRGGKGLGEQRNEPPIIERRGFGELEVRYPRDGRGKFRPPRRTGGSKQRKQIGQVRAMAPRVARKAAERIAEELGGA